MSKHMHGIDVCAYCAQGDIAREEVARLKARVAELEAAVNAARDEAAELHARQLAAISTASLCNTDDSRELWAIERGNECWSVAYSDVCEAVRREMDARVRAETAEARVAELEALLHGVAQDDCSAPMYGYAAASSRDVLCYMECATCRARAALARVAE